MPNQVATLITVTPASGTRFRPQIYVLMKGNGNGNEREPKRNPPIATQYSLFLICVPLFLPALPITEQIDKRCTQMEGDFTNYRYPRFLKKRTAAKITTTIITTSTTC